MVSHMQAPVLCVCIGTRIGAIFTAGGEKPVFIMELHNEAINEPLIKYLNCNSTTEGNYKVPHNSDFAKLYRLTIGDNPTKRFSKAHQLLSHFLGHRFIAKYQNAHLKKGQQYLKVTRIEPETPARNNAWTLDGTLKKTTQKIPFQPPKNGDEVATLRRRSGEIMSKNRRQVGDGETPQAAISLGLEPDFHPTKTLNTRTLSHLPTNTAGDWFLDLPAEARAFYNERLDILVNNFEFEKVEAVDLAKQATEMQFAEKIAASKFSLQDHDDWMRAYDGIKPRQEQAA